MNTTEYGRRAARKYIDAYKAQGASRYTVGCNLTWAENMLGKYALACDLAGTSRPAYGETGNRQDDVLRLAEGILAA